jgi:predicted kinase
MPNKPKCIIVTGRPGAGKTTLSKALGERLRLPVVSRDALKEGYVRTLGVAHDQLPTETNALVSGLFFDLVAHYLAGNVSVIIEAAFQHKVWEARLPALAEIAELVLVLCSVDEALALERHLQRGLDDPARAFYHGDSLPGEYLAPALALPTISVSTKDGYVPRLDDIVANLLLDTGLKSGDELFLARDHVP